MSSRKQSRAHIQKYSMLLRVCTYNKTSKKRVVVYESISIYFSGGCLCNRGAVSRHILREWKAGGRDCLAGTHFNRERCVWELTKTETELWKEPEDPVLEKIKELVTETTPEWAGTATELVEVLQVEMQPNALSRKLNVSLERLILEYGIQYKTERGHDGRKIRLAFVGKQA